MGIINWFKEFFGLGGNNSDPKEKEDDALAGYDTDVVREKKSKQSEEKASKDNKIVNINATTQLEVVLVKP
ncbi:MAG: hypothetical protein J6U30_07265, partial [Oscillospiraceae bacterium]|nr:hypothetical protein [Oscillospiraceae bacterium]